MFVSTAGRSSLTVKNWGGVLVSEDQLQSNSMKTKISLEISAQTVKTDLEACHGGYFLAGKRQRSLSSNVSCTSVASDLDLF